MGTGLYIGEEAIGMVRAGTFLEGGGIDTSDATATSGDILNGKTAYAKGSKVTGTIQSQAAQTITPGTADQTIAAGKYLSGTQTIKGDANLVSDNIVSGKSIFGVAGSHTCSTPSGTIDITTNGTHDVTDYASANVNVPSTGIDTSDATAAADNIENGYTAYVNGEKIIGSLLVPTKSTSLAIVPGFTEKTGTATVSSSVRSFTINTGLESVDGILITKDSLTPTANQPLAWIYTDAAHGYVYSAKIVNTSYWIKYADGEAVSTNGGTVTVSSSNAIRSGDYYWVAWGKDSTSDNTILKSVAEVTLSSDAESFTIDTNLDSVSGFVVYASHGSKTGRHLWVYSDILKGHASYSSNGDLSMDLYTSADDTTISVNGSYITMASPAAHTYQVVAYGTANYSGIDTSDATATAADIASGKTAYVNGEKLTGTHECSGGTTPNLQEKSATPTTSVQTITPDSGYDGLSQVTVNAIPSNYIEPTGNKEITANGTGIDVAAYATVSVNVPSEGVSLQEKSVTPSTSTQTITPDNGYGGLSQVTVAAMPTATQATPSITVSTSGLITAKSTQSSGYVESGTKSATKQLTTKAATTYTPGTANQTISSGTYLTGVQTISGDSNLVAANIKSGVSIFGVAGSYSGSGGAGGSTGGLVMKTGTTTSATIDTGLSSISFITIYKDSLTATGLIQGVYSTDEGTLHYTYCSSYSGYFKMCTVGTSTASSVSGGTFTLGTSGTSGLSSSTTYNWIAFGAE